MAIQRTYSLPNCTLLIEGISLGEGNTLALLTNFECRFHHNQSLVSGGRKLLDALTASVSRYAQTIQKGEPISIEYASVRLEPTGEFQHCLNVQPSEDALNREPLKIQLNTVQLFDLMDSIDRLCSDRDTLPDLTLVLDAGIASKSKSKSQSNTLPALTGIAGLAIAAVTLLFIPIPQPKLQPQSSQTLPTPIATPSPPPPVIADKELIVKLEQDLTQQIEKNWKTTPTFTEPLVYRVAVNEKSEIVGYRAMSEIVTVPENELPLKKLRVIPIDPQTSGSPTKPQPTITFYITFKPDSTFTVDRKKPNS